jgi:hypothetical protein
MSDIFDELRIIAKDARGLPTTDREVLVRAADELENAYRMLVSTQACLIESQARQIALNDALLGIKRAANPPGVRFSGVFGWVVFP